MKALEFGLAGSRRKLGEALPGEITQSITPKGHGEVAEKAYNLAIIERPVGLRFIPSWLREGIDICTNMRGLGWDFGVGTYIPEQQRPLERSPFLAATLLSFVRNYLILDFLEWSLKLLPGVGDTQGGSIFYPQLHPLQRYVVSTGIHIITGSCLISGFRMCYDLSTMICVATLHDPPGSWPPVMFNPWVSNSLHEFWAKRWHQLLRRTFIVAGGYPGQLIAGNTGMVFGTFIASGLFHELAIYAMGRGFDYRVPLYFSIQGPLLGAERYWRKRTGRRVGGWAGRIWVYFVIFLLGQGMSTRFPPRGMNIG